MSPVTLFGLAVVVILIIAVALPALIFMLGWLAAIAAIVGGFIWWVKSRA